MQVLLLVFAEPSLHEWVPDSRHAKPRLTSGVCKPPWSRKEVLMYLLMLFLHLISIRKRRIKLTFQITLEL
jgi:hypothetical protein